MMRCFSSTSRSSLAHFLSTPPRSFARLINISNNGNQGRTRRLSTFIQTPLRSPTFLPRLDLAHHVTPRLVPDGHVCMVNLEKKKPMKLETSSVSFPVIHSMKTRNHDDGDDARKLLHFARMEYLRRALNQVPSDSVSYSELVEMCKECVAGSTSQQSIALARSLDLSGNVLLSGSGIVFLHRDQVARAVQGLVSQSVVAEDPRRKELERMEMEKEGIDGRAERLVRRELWLGLGLVVLQTAASMRLTFWELSWDVMEPICFFGSCFYFIAGYAFFLTTSRDPSFQELFRTRFNIKQRRLMQQRNFDLQRFDELQKLFKFPSSSSSASLLRAQQHS